MGHLSFFKGVDTILKAFRQIIRVYPDSHLVIANNSVRGDKELLEEVERLRREFPNNLVVKGVVNPIEELTSCWVYLYPFKEAIGTMAFAMSLHEAEVCGTPYVACDVGANSEFFDIERLISIDDDRKLVAIVSKIFDEGADR